MFCFVFSVVCMQNINILKVIFKIKTANLYSFDNWELKIF